MKKFIRLFAYLFFLLSIWSCVYTSTYFKKIDIKVNFAKNNSFFDNDCIRILKGMFTIDNGIVDLYFSSISGGKTYLFGKIPISESNVEKAKRLKIMCKEEIYEFEINEILKWDKVDDVFIAPKLCD